MVLENGGDDVIGGGGDGGGGGGDGRGEVVHRQRRITLPAGILLADANPQHEEQTRSLIRIAIYNISYIRGLFPEKYFTDKSALVVEMKINKLMHMDADSRSLIHWISKVSFSYPNSNGEEVAMNMSRTGIKKNSATFKSNAAEVTPDQMRCSACKMIRRLLRSLDPMPEKEMIEDVLEKLLSDDLLSRASKDGYAVIKISDPGTPYMEKEVSMHNVSPTDGANIDNGDLKCMKVKKPILQYQAPQVPAH